MTQIVSPLIPDSDSDMTEGVKSLNDNNNKNCIFFVSCLESPIKRETQGKDETERHDSPFIIQKFGTHIMGPGTRINYYYITYTNI